jgi:hypothetical protein
MVRTQIQLTEGQAQKLKRLAALRGVSMAELVREGVGLVLETASASAPGDKMRRAMRAFGVARSGTNDLATRHDEAFAEAASPRAASARAASALASSALPVSHAARARRPARRA